MEQFAAVLALRDLEELAGITPFDDDEDWEPGTRSQLRRAAYELQDYLRSVK